MTAKDYMYLGLMALTALVFYCHGYCGGIVRSRRIYESLLEEEKPPTESAEAAAFKPPAIAVPIHVRKPAPLPARRGFPQDFGNN